MSESQKIAESMGSPEKLILYAISDEKNNIRHKVEIQKLIFFTSRVLPEAFENVFHFEPHKKGPYSEEVEDSLDSIKDKQLVSENLDLTDLGVEVSSQITPKQPLKGIIDDYGKMISRLTEDELLTLVYVSYPEYTKNSEEWERLIKIRKKSAAAMLKKNSISFSKAVEISGESSLDFEKYLIENNIRWRCV